MPYKKRVKKSYRRKTKPKSASLAKTVSPTPFSNKLVTKMRYNENLVHVPASTAHNYQYRLNSLYDPNLTGSGHQCMYYDQLANIYNRYRVSGVKYRITFTNVNTPCRVGVVPTNNDIPTDMDDLTVMPYNRHGIINTMSSGGKTSLTLSGYVSLKKLLGESLNDDRDQAITNASPSNVVPLNIMTESLDKATTITTLNYIVELTYYSTFFDLIPVAGS
uniref:Capsid protein n=1 Tax=uncultured marine virus TaxID=186617 RepID=S4TEG3_9VIRU|nr:hypothetical protein [uncultured marine virus]